MTTISVLDTSPLSSGDLSWGRLESLGKCRFFEQTAPEEVLAHCEAAQVVLTNKVPLSAETISQLPQLRYIGVMATGYNIVDVAAAKKAGITVTNVPTYGSMSVAQHTIALLLALTNHVGLHSHEVSEGEWNRRNRWSYWRKPLLEISGKQLGIVGRGTIGQCVAVAAEALGMKIQSVSSGDETSQLDHLFSTSDVVSLHCPLTPQTRELINSVALSKFKHGALLINTARGALLNEADVLAALSSGHLGGAALDVLSAEPPPPDHPLLTAPNCIITPHIAWASTAARTRLQHVAIENVHSFLNGHLQNVVK